MGGWSGWRIRWNRVVDCLLRRDGPQAKLPRGERAEMIAERRLRAAGARILARNARYRGGEIDLIAEDEGCIAFVEVRLRSNADFGGAAASITIAKQRRIALAARQWLAAEGSAWRNRPCRFDAVLLDSLEPARIEWLKSAYEMPS